MSFYRVTAAVRGATLSAYATRATSSSRATSVVRPAFVCACVPRRSAITSAFERSANTSELLDFEKAQADVPKWKKQLMYRSRQRGWLELDLIMGTWADENLHKLTVPQLEDYARIVASENPDLIKIFVEKMPLPPHLEGNVVAETLVNYAQQQKKQWTVQTGNQ